MKISESGVILSIPQLRLCMKLLDCPQWNDLPLIATEEPPEQRIMNAFLGVVQAGWLCSTPEGYAFESDFRDLMLRIGRAERRYLLFDGDQILSLLYECHGSVVAVMPDWGNRDHCKVLPCIADVVDDAARILAPERNGLILQQQNDTDAISERHSMEQFGFFFGLRMEETE